MIVNVSTDDQRAIALIAEFWYAPIIWEPTGVLTETIEHKSRPT